MVCDLVVAVVVGVLQGIVEWLPVSSQGNLALVLTALGSDPEIAFQLALFFQLGTTLSAASYYRAEITTTLSVAPRGARRLPSTARPGWYRLSYSHLSVRGLLGSQCICWQLMRPAS